MTEIARGAGVSREHLYRALKETGNPRTLHRGPGAKGTGLAPLRAADHRAEAEAPDKGREESGVIFAKSSPTPLSVYSSCIGRVARTKLDGIEANGEDATWQTAKMIAGLKTMLKVSKRYR